MNTDEVRNRWGTMELMQVSNLVFYAQSTSIVISGRELMHLHGSDGSKQSDTDGIRQQHYGVDVTT